MLNGINSAFNNLPIVLPSSFEVTTRMDAVRHCYGHTNQVGNLRRAGADKWVFLVAETNLREI